MTRRSPVGSVSAYLQQTLVWMRKNGFKPVLLHPRSKAAINREYVSPDYQPPGDDAWARGDYGLGAVTGPRQGGFVDTDLDCGEALFFVNKFFPPTDAIFGRASKPRSHYLYKVETSAFEKIAFTDPVTQDTVIELRGDGGHQTVMPGSVHQDTGEDIKWSNLAFPEVTTVPASDLIRAAKKVAIATLISRHVWADGYHNEPTKHLSGLFFYLEWTEDEAVQMIEALMEYSGDADKSRISTVRLTYRRGGEGKKVSGAGVLRKQLKNDVVVDKLLEWAGSNSVNVVQEYNEKFAVVSLEGRFRIADTEVGPGETPVFYLKDDFINMQAVDLSDQVDDKGRSIPKARIWLANPRRRQYRGVDYLPGQDDTGTVLNLWTGWGVEPNPDGSCKAWLDLLKNVICGGDAKLSDWLLHWFANIVREPLNKSLTAPVIIGPEGAGKSLLLGYFGRILGPAYITVTNEEHIYGRFNKHIASTLLLHSEEALYGGEKKHAGIIRSLITDEFRIYEQKGVDAKRVQNYLRLVLTSNEAHAAPAKPGDRRYTVVDMGDRKASERQVKEVLKELNNGGPAALFKFLLEMKYDPKLPRVNVKNDALIGMKSINMSVAESWWHDALFEGNLLPDVLSWAQDPPKADWPAVVAGPALYASMSLYAQRHQKRSLPNGTLFAMNLERFTNTSMERARRRFQNPLAEDAPQMVKTMNERMSAVVNMPPLAQCREAFEKYLGQQIEWPADGDDNEPEEHEKF